MNAIVAVDRDWGIGRDGALLAHLSEDLKYFREKTLGKTLIMGRKTLESLPGGRPLPGRKTIVLSRSAGGRAEVYNGRAAGCANNGRAADGNAPDAAGEAVWLSSPEEALEYVRAEGTAPEEVFVCGGESIYRAFLKYCRRFYVTKIDASLGADRFFPNLDDMLEAGEFKLISESDIFEENGLKYSFLMYSRDENDIAESEWLELLLDMRL